VQGPDQPLVAEAGWPPEPPLRVVRETLLSRRPHAAAGRVALGGVSVLIATSLLYWSGPAGVVGGLPASGEGVFGRGEYWRLLTSLGAHSDPAHLLANAALFGLLSYLLYGYYGAVVFPGLATLLGATTTGIALLGYPPEARLVGASGMVYAMAAFWLVLYLLVERRLRPGRRLLRAVGFAAIVLLPTAIEPRVSYRAHAIGFALGGLAGALFFGARRKALRAGERVEWE
jgi:rhomboid protease GluP